MTDAQLVDVERSLWTEAERLSHAVHLSRAELALMEARLAALETRVDTHRLSVEQLSSPIPQACPHDARERMQLLESAFGIRLRRVGRGLMKVTLSFEPPVPQLQLVIGVDGELSVQSCVPTVIGIDSLIREVNKSSAEGHLARFLLNVRVRHRKQRSPH